METLNGLAPVCDTGLDDDFYTNLRWPSSRGDRHPEAPRSLPGPAVLHAAGQAGVGHLRPRDDEVARPQGRGLLLATTGDRDLAVDRLKRP